MSILAFLAMAAAEPVEQSKLLNSREIFTADDYPYWAKQREEEGRVIVVVTVAASGAPSSCRVRDTSGSPSLDIGTCDIMMRRARFTPARDKNGKPVEDVHTTMVDWALISRGPMEIEDSTTRVVYLVDENRQPTDCRVEETKLEDIDPRDCPEQRGIAQEMIARSPTSFEWREWQFVLEDANFAGAPEKASLVGKGPGKVLFDRSIIRLTVDPKGDVTRCDFIENAMFEMESNEHYCARTIKNSKFVPAPGGGDRLFTLVSASYLEKRF